jgi:hypothetical protein
MSPGFEELHGRICRSQKALYGLRGFPLLWQLKLTDAFRRMDFREIPQWSCVTINNGIIVFFYVDDIFELTDVSDLKS